MVQTYIMSGMKSDFTTKYSPPISLDESKQNEAALLSIDLFNSIPNITNLNNVLRYSKDDGNSWVNIELDTGSYELSAINNEFQRLMAINGDYDRTADNPYYITITANLSELKSIVGTQQTWRSCIYFLFSLFRLLLQILHLNSICTIQNSLKSINFLPVISSHTRLISRFDGTTTNLNDSFSFSSSSFARAGPIMVFIGVDPPLLPTRFGETMNLNITKLLEKINFQSPFRTISHTLLSFFVFRTSNVSIGVNLLLSPDHISRTYGLINSSFHSYPSDFAENEYIFQQPHISSYLIPSNRWPPFLLAGPPFYCRRKSRSNLLVLLLLLISGVEVNPGPLPAGSCLGVLNVRSAVNKAPLLHSLIADNDISILALTETWVKSDDPPVIQNSLAPPGYRILHVHREDPDRARGGGLAVIHQDTINVQPRSHNIPHSSFELQIVNISLKPRDIVLVNIYRPPSSSKSVFFEEFGTLLTTLGIDVVNRLLICGDLNLPGVTPDTHDDELLRLLHSTSFTQLVNSPTRYDTHHDKFSLLDLIITPSSSKLVSSTLVVPSHEISDHCLVLAKLNTVRPKPPQRTYQYRDIKNINLDIFKQTIESSTLFSDPAPTVDGFVNQMESNITSILDELAPLKTGHRSGPRHSKNWLSPMAIEAKKRRRRLERRWKSSNEETDRLAYRASCRSANALITESRIAANLERINEASKNPRSLWSSIKTLLHSSPPSEQLPPSVSKPLAESLASFFKQKIISLKQAIALKLNGPPSPFDFDQPHNQHLLSEYTPVTPLEVSKLLHSMSGKSSPLDFIPTSLLKSCSDTFSILIAHLADLSFSQGVFPSKFKLAQISPLLKKPGLSKSDPSNFRPISNLNTIGKILERLALARLLPHLSISPSFPPLQSAYRKFHSTETALLKLTNDIKKVKVKSLLFDTPQVFDFLKVDSDAALLPS